MKTRAMFLYGNERHDNHEGEHALDIPLSAPVLMSRVRYSCTKPAQQTVS
jgi:hypothetical protein